MAELIYRACSLRAALGPSRHRYCARDAVAAERDDRCRRNDHDLRRLIEHTLVFDGFKVVGAAHGAEALALMNADTPGLVVLDLVLPWVNGIEVLTTMRQTEGLRRVPVLVVTGTPTHAHDLRHLQPLMLLHKPFNVEALAPIVHQLLATTSKH